MLALLAAGALAAYINGWHAIAGDAQSITFALQSSVSGPSTARTVTALTVRPADQDIVKSAKFSISYNCADKTGQYLSMQRFAAPNEPIAPPETPRFGPRAFILGSIGEQLYNFVCTAPPDGMGHGHAIMLDPYVVADQFIRLQRLGIQRDIAMAIAALDPHQAPKTYEDALNAGVPLYRQAFVRAIKEVP